MARKDFSGATTSVAYYFSDHLKTTSVITNSAGVIIEDEDYYPWGGELQFVNSDSNHYKFTGKEGDSETGLDYFGARCYGNWLGRWMSPDWAAKPEAVPYSDLDDPQSLNLYSYVRNVPTSRADLDGHDWPTVSGLVDFTVGLLNAWGSDNLAGAGRMEQTTLSGKIGQAVGDLGATIQGGLETLAGGCRRGRRDCIGWNRGRCGSRGSIEYCLRWSHRSRLCHHRHRRHKFPQRHYWRE